jgi:hypothetical protein
LPPASQIFLVTTSYSKITNRRLRIKIKFLDAEWNFKKPLFIARRFLPKRSFCKQETASLKNARRDGF